MRPKNLTIFPAWALRLLPVGAWATLLAAAGAVVFTARLLWPEEVHVNFPGWAALLLAAAAVAFAGWLLWTAPQ